MTQGNLRAQEIIAMPHWNVRLHTARPLWTGIVLRWVLNFYEFEISVIE